MSTPITALMNAMLPDENSTLVLSLKSMLAFAPREPCERDRYRLKVHSLFADAFAIATAEWFDAPEITVSGIEQIMHMSRHDVVCDCGARFCYESGVPIARCMTCGRGYDAEARKVLRKLSAAEVKGWVR